MYNHCDLPDLSDLEHSRLTKRFLEYDRDHLEGETFEQWLRRMREELGQ